MNDKRINNKKKKIKIPRYFLRIKYIFQARYNKKKRGPYKEAIRQAQSEAQIQISSDSSTENVANVCKSSREVNVIS